MRHWPPRRRPTRSAAPMSVRRRVGRRNDDYWKTDEGFPAGRSPISRPYLARLVTEVARFHPTVIALDFDLRAEHTDPQKAQGPAAEGICQLAAAIHKVTADPAHLKVVLAKSLWKETT